MLDKALRGYAPFPMEGDRARVGNSIILIKKLMSCRNTHLKNQRMMNKVELAIGGIITPILLKCKVEITDNPTALTLLDMTYLRSSHIIDNEKVEEKYAYNFSHPELENAKVLLPLPRDAYRTLYNNGSMAFILPMELLYRKSDGADDFEVPLRQFAQTHKEQLL